MILNKLSKWKWTWNTIAQRGADRGCSLNEWNETAAGERDLWVFCRTSGDFASGLWVGWYNGQSSSTCRIYALLLVNIGCTPPLSLSSSLLSSTNLCCSSFGSKTSWGPSNMPRMCGQFRADDKHARVNRSQTDPHCLGVLVQLWEIWLSIISFRLKCSNVF